jgi:hypothetical protein
MKHQREATLDELLSDTIILKVMASDGVRSDDIRSLVRQAHSRMRQPALHWPRPVAGNAEQAQRSAPGQV